MTESNFKEESIVIINYPLFIPINGTGYDGFYIMVGGLRRTRVGRSFRRSFSLVPVWRWRYNDAGVEFSAGEGEEKAIVLGVLAGLMMGHFYLLKKVRFVAHNDDY